VSIFFFFLLLGILVYSAIKYRRKSETQPPASRLTHHTMLEVVWTLIPTIIVMIIFAWGWKGQIHMAVAPGDAHQFHATAFMYGWDFGHPGTTGKTDEIFVPLNEPVRFTLESRDVLHSFFVPAMRAKRDVVPGRYQSVWFTPTRLGDFPLFCAEYCGQGHSLMHKVVHVIPRPEWDTKPWEKMPDDPAERGAIYHRRYCGACHTVDGSPLTGPTFKNLWGKEETLEDGSTVTVDADYVLESVRDPEKKRVEGFTGKAMTPWPESMVSDDAVADIVEYLKSLKSE
jgi:cytochrome c oxidase subunit 2